MNKPDKYQRVMEYVRQTPWAMLSEKIKDVMAFLNDKNNGVEIVDAEQNITHDVRAQEAGNFTRVGSLAVIPIFGVISRRVNIMTLLSGATSSQKLAASVRRASKDQDVSAIVLDIDSPGGVVPGIQELATEIRDAREKKPVVAVANGMAASAAYWIAASASEVVVTPSGQVGSIGAFIVHDDISERLKMQGIKTTLIAAGKFKTDGSPFEPLSKTARAKMQEVVDEVLDQFVADVAAGRGVSTEKVLQDFGEGNMVMAKAAKSAGMVDRIATMDQTVVRLLRNTNRTGSAVPSTAREFEAFLRDEGTHSNAEAKRIAGLVFKGETQRDVAEDVDLESHVEKIRNILL